MAKIKISYRVDLRLDLAQISTGSVNFLVPVDYLTDILGQGIREEEERRGSDVIALEDYSMLRRNEVNGRHEKSTRRSKTS
jgi:hypothetical protein